VVFVEGGGWNLGRMRNLTIDNASGPVLCQWDDDDLYHPRRVERQVEVLLARRALACFLTAQLQYFYEANELYWTDWDYKPPRPGLREEVIPGTVMCLRSAEVRYPEDGPCARSGEDEVFLDQLIASGPVAKLPGEAHLYVYTFHGANVFSLAHHRKIIRGRGRDADFVRSGRALLERELACYDWPRPLVRVCGKDGTAFVYHAGRGAEATP
jgi:glycosyltransferase involved in cell wall biosynthesis